MAFVVDNTIVVGNEEIEPLIAVSQKDFTIRTLHGAEGGPHQFMPPNHGSRRKSGFSAQNIACLHRDKHAVSGIVPNTMA